MDLNACSGVGGKLEACADGGDLAREWRRFLDDHDRLVLDGISVVSLVGSRHPAVGTAVAQKAFTTHCLRLCSDENMTANCQERTVDLLRINEKSKKQSMA